MISQILWRWAILGLALLSLQSCAIKIPAEDLSLVKAGRTYNRLGEYLIGPDDAVAISVVGEDAVSGTYKVSPKGFLALPIVGNVKAVGLSVVELTKALEKKLERFLREPTVSVQIAEIQNLFVYFAGEVNSVGRVALQAKTNLLQGVILAGGLTNFATGRIVLIRDAGNDTKKRYATRYEDLLVGRYNLDGFYLESGDIIHVE